MSTYADRITESRRWMAAGYDPARVSHVEHEGGCGVTGFACNVPVRGKHIYAPSVQMHNRGNGKGGGIAAIGLTPEQMGVSREVLSEDYLLQIALLDPACRNTVEADLITPFYDIHSARMLDHIDSYHDVEGLEVRPPEVMQYFVRVKPDALKRFAAERGLDGILRSSQNDMERFRDIEDEFVYQNTFELNSRYYASLGDKQAFVLSRGRDQLILKIVGYAEQIVRYYKLEDLRAHVWMAHQRYPTRGRMWHPGGAHPFCGLNEALVHNGDFANYHSVTEYLAERNIVPLFLTDTEVSILVFDLWNRVYKYPLEYIFEGLAPTGEHDFDMLPKDKQEVYRQIQRAHIHASPDGPWFFIIAQNDVASDSFRLMGITDTAMLRPQVFALQDGEVQVGLICSEKQAIDATLASLASEDSRFCTIADDYWNARGASYTDGGAFVFTLKRNGDGSRSLTCADKFGRQRKAESGKWKAGSGKQGTENRAEATLADESGSALFDLVKEAASALTLDEFRALCLKVAGRARTDAEVTAAVNGLTLAIDRRYPTGASKHARILEAVTQALVSVFEAVPSIVGEGTGRFARIDWETRDALREPRASEEVLVVNAHDFPPEGDDCDARLVVKARELGWREFMCYGYAGQRFVACGLGPGSEGVVIDAYGSSGDYLGSGLDGATVIVHGNAQDQVAQIIKEGKLVVHGDVGQTFMYGAKGGTVFVKGNAAGRPLINAVGRPKAIINGTCLDFLAESFMAGDPLAGGGFVILNGVRLDADGSVVELDTPYPGSNLFSLASGGAIYVRDPRRLLDDEQLNGGEYVELAEADWKLIKPYLDENERLFDIPVASLLTVDGIAMEPARVYRKVAPIKRKAAAVVATVPDDDTNVGEVSDE